MGADGEKGFCKVYKADRNGKIKREILKLVIPWYWKIKTDIDRLRQLSARIIGVHTNRNGDMNSVILYAAHSSSGNQILQRPITKIMLLVENEIDSPMKGANRISQDETLTSWDEPNISEID